MLIYIDMFYDIFRLGKPNTIWVLSEYNGNSFAGTRWNLNDLFLRMDRRAFRYIFLNSKIMGQQVLAIEIGLAQEPGILRCSKHHKTEEPNGSVIPGVPGKHGRP